MITVIAAIIQHDDKILITRRAPEQKLAGLWEFPGGKLEPGEREELCLMREIKEELNLTIAIRERWGEACYSYPFGDILLVAYLCAYLGGEISLIVHDACRWVGVKELGSYSFAPADEPFIQRLTTEA